mmetsp:Transcript_148577/g.259674  ORF Transcript_148577/g.259674 Transcript_148577/m.259674 type:complete len:90 (-) Transcript_148577:91-360(-)
MCPKPEKIRVKNPEKGPKIPDRSTVDYVVAFEQNKCMKSVASQNGTTNALAGLRARCKHQRALEDFFSNSPWAGQGAVSTTEIPMTAFC